jgi:hypothetical protein
LAQSRAGGEVAERGRVEECTRCQAEPDVGPDENAHGTVGASSATGGGAPGDRRRKRPGADTARRRS